MQRRRERSRGRLISHWVCLLSRGDGGLSATAGRDLDDGGRGDAGCLAVMTFRFYLLFPTWTLLTYFPLYLSLMTHHDLISAWF